MKTIIIVLCGMFLTVVLLVVALIATLCYYDSLYEDEDDGNDEYL